jgi:hypothetical protein
MEVPFLGVIPVVEAVVKVLTVKVLAIKIEGGFIEHGSPLMPGSNTRSRHRIRA